MSDERTVQPAGDPAEAVFATALAARCHPQIAEMIDYWRRIRPGPGRLPGRQHFDPVDVPKLLPFTGLVDILREPDLRLKVRLAGSKIAETLGPGLVGHYLDELVPNFAATLVAQDYFRVATDGIPVWYRGKQTSDIGKAFLPVERLFLPLATDGRTPDAIVGMMVFGAQIR